MIYFILRNGLQFGPYSRPDVQDFLRSGELFPGDLCRTESMNQWLPISQVLGIAAPPPPSSSEELNRLENLPAVSEQLRLTSRKPFPPSVIANPHAPPSLHWTVLLLLIVVTLGLFGWLWSFLIARRIDELDPRSRATHSLAVSAALCFPSGLFLALSPSSTPSIIAAVLIQLFGISLFLYAMFALRSSIFTCYFPHDSTPPLLTATMTLFFTIVYFQYLFNHARRPHTQSTTDIELPRNAS